MTKIKLVIYYESLTLRETRVILDKITNLTCRLDGFYDHYQVTVEIRPESEIKKEGVLPS